MTVNGLEPKIRHRLDNWKLWMGIAYIGLAATVVGLFIINQSTQRAVVRQSRDEAAHSAEIVANAKAQYVQCVKSRPTLLKINAFAAGVNVISDALIDNSQATLRLTAKTDHLYPTRKRNLKRLERASLSAKRIHFIVPSVAQCRELRARLLKSP